MQRKLYSLSLYQGSKVSQNFEVELKNNQSLTNTTANCIYMIQCLKDNCNMRYSRETKPIMKHRGYVTNKILSTSTGEHLIFPVTV